LPGLGRVVARAGFVEVARHGKDRAIMRRYL